MATQESDANCKFGGGVCDGINYSTRDFCGYGGGAYEGECEDNGTSSDCGVDGTYDVNHDGDGAGYEDSTGFGDGDGSLVNGEHVNVDEHK